MYKDDLSRKKLGHIVKMIHQKIPKQQIDTTAIGDYERRKGFLERTAIERLIIYMRSSGCQWMLEDEFSGCTMCGHYAGSTLGSPIKAEDYIHQFNKIISQFDFKDIPMLCIYNAGSFFNNREMPQEARNHIYKTLHPIKDIKHIIFESRPEYISEQEMKHLRDSLPDKALEIGIGLESSNEYIRQVCLNKGCDLSKVLQALEIIKINKIKVLAYVLLKPPFLDENPAIEDAISSIDWAFKNGADVVSLEPVSVQNFTLTQLLYNMQLFRPPWIWSVFEVLKNTGNKGFLRIGGFEFFPPPSICTHNCPSCNEVCVNAIEEYNASNDLTVILNAQKMECKTCKKTWEVSLKSASSAKTNVERFLETFRVDLIDRYMRNNFRRYPNHFIRIGSCVTPNL